MTSLTAETSFDFLDCRENTKTRNNRVFHSWDFGPTWAPTSASNLAQVGTQVGARNRSWMPSRAQELDLTSKLANLGPNLELQLRLTAPVSHQSGYLTLQLGPPTWPILDQVEGQVGAQVGPKKPTVKHPNCCFSYLNAPLHSGCTAHSRINTACNGLLAGALFKMSATFHGRKYKIIGGESAFRFQGGITRNENRTPSPIPSASQGAQSTSLGLGTPLHSQRSVLSARTLAQRAQREHEAAAKAAGTSTNRPPRPMPRPVGADGPGQLSVGQQAHRQNERNDYGFVGDIIWFIPLHETVDSIASMPDNDNGKPLEPEVQIPKINTEYLPYLIFSGLPFNGNKDKGMFDIDIGQYTQLSKVMENKQVNGSPYKNRSKIMVDNVVYLGNKFRTTTTLRCHNLIVEQVEDCFYI
ncbi:hypothetical protein B0H13DRAFT_2505060 [Mycena leptocephala]|nr:hypothetical protein B0H13DRAFT_2505060 [Mycena leptocephala]